jgi:hypothetical protein
MFVQIIESRYTVDHDILKSYLKDLFGEGKFEIIVSMLKQDFFFGIRLTQGNSLQTKERNGRYEFHGR